MHCNYALAILALATLANMTQRLILVKLVAEIVGNNLM